MRFMSLSYVSTPMEPGLVAFAIALLLIGVHVNAQDTIVVDTKNGPVRGSIVAANGHKAARFLGIPYAEPPVGKLRFQVLMVFMLLLERIMFDEYLGSGSQEIMGTKRVECDSGIHQLLSTAGKPSYKAACAIPKR